MTAQCVCARVCVCSVLFLFALLFHAVFCFLGTGFIPLCQAALTWRNLFSSQPVDLEKSVELMDNVKYCKISENKSIYPLKEDATRVLTSDWMSHPRLL